jgi:Putative sugar-binding domain.
VPPILASSSPESTNKWAPLRAALRGGWVDVLITDLASARYLISHAD